MESPKNLRSLADKISTCAYFGIFDCNCCELQNKLLKNSQDIVKKEITTRTLDINEPSTSSTDADFIDFNFCEEERQLKEYEEKFAKLMNSTFSTTEDEEIDVVNDVPCFESNVFEEEQEIDVVNDVEMDKSFIDFNEDAPLALFIESNKPVRSNCTQNENVNIENEQEIVVNDVEMDKSFIDFNEDAPLALFIESNKPVRSNFTQNENVKIENDQNDQEIDVVSVTQNETENIEIKSDENHENNQEIDEDAPLSTLIRPKPQNPVPAMSEFDENAPLSSFIKTQPENTNSLRRKRKKLRRNAPENTIDVINLTNDSTDYAFLSNLLVEANRNLMNSPVVDLRRCTPDDSIIEISDSPCPKIIPEIITVEDDDSEEKKSGFGPCPVCFEDLAKCSEVMSTMCGHIFCASCIKTVVKNVKKCPKCRKHLTLKSVHPLFF